MSKVRSILGSVVVEPIVVENKTASGIILGDSEVKPLPRGKVVHTGKKVEEVKVGDTVVYLDGRGYPEVNGLFVLPESSIIAIIDEN